MNSKRNWLIAGLAISLAINLTLAGYLLGRSVPGAKGPPLADPGHWLGASLGVLPKHRRAELSGPLRGQMRGIGRDLRRLRDLRADISRAVRAQPLDRDALETSLAAFRAELAAIQARSHETLVKALQAMTAEERKLVLRELSRRERRNRPA